MIERQNIPSEDKNLSEKILYYIKSYLNKKNIT